MDSASPNQVGPILILGSDVSGWHDVVNELHCALDSNIAERDSSHQGSWHQINWTLDNLGNLEQLEASVAMQLENQKHLLVLREMSGITNNQWASMGFRHSEHCASKKNGVPINQWRKDLAMTRCRTMMHASWSKLLWGSFIALKQDSWFPWCSGHRIESYWWGVIFPALPEPLKNQSASLPFLLVFRWHAQFQPCLQCPLSNSGKLGHTLAKFLIRSLCQNV